MDNRSNTRLVLIIGFGFVLLLLISLIATSVHSIRNNQQRVVQLKEDNSILVPVNKMRNVALSRSLILFHMITEFDPFERDELQMKFSELAVSFIIARQKLESMRLSTDTTRLLTEALNMVKKGQLSQNETIRLLIDEDDLAAANSQLRFIVMPTQKITMLSFERLLDASSMEVKVSINQLSNENDRIIIVISILGVIAIFLGTLISVYVTTRIIRSEEGFVFQIQQKEIAIQASQAKSLFLANMSHEIRSPLTAIIGFSETISNLNISNEKKSELNHRILGNSIHLSQIINNILDLSKIEAEQMDLEKKTTSLVDLFFKVDSLVSMQIKNKGLEFSINYNFPLPSTIKTDVTRLLQILVNLTNNATKFTKNGRIVIDVSCEIESRKMFFSVIDTGIGMTEDQVERIFSAYSQAETNTTRKFGGTGLGLSISKQLTELLGGKIECKSVEGIGSRFTFFIDVGRLDNTKLLHSLEEIKFTTISSDKPNKFNLSGHVLLAEDLKDNQDLIEMYVVETGAKITIVENGKLAVEACEKMKFDLILMDMQMPVLNGVDATRQLRQNNVRTPIIALSANTMKSDIDQFVKAGATDYTCKPIDTKRFYELLNTYLPQSDENINSNIAIENNSVIQTKNNAAKKSIRLENIKSNFLDDLPNRIRIINKALLNEEWTLVESESHKLKGLGTTLGFPDITTFCTEIIEYCDSKYYEELPNSIEALTTYSQSIYTH